MGGWQVWDRRRAEADWFAHKILRPKLRANPDSLVISSVRRGDDW